MEPPVSAAGTLSSRSLRRPITSVPPALSEQCSLQRTRTKAPRWRSTRWRRAALANTSGAVVSASPPAAPARTPAGTGQRLRLDALGPARAGRLGVDAQELPEQRGEVL